MAFLQAKRGMAALRAQFSQSTSNRRWGDVVEGAFYVLKRRQRVFLIAETFLYT